MRDLRDGNEGVGVPKGDDIENRQPLQPISQGPGDWHDAPVCVRTRTGRMKFIAAVGEQAPDFGCKPECARTPALPLASLACTATHARSPRSAAERGCGASVGGCSGGRCAKHAVDGARFTLQTPPRMLRQAQHRLRLERV